ncbi:MAG: hypothetical protein R6V10_10680 [bacterium]
MKKSAWLFALVFLISSLSGSARAEDPARLEVRAFPEKPPALVWIDTVEMHATPLNLPDFRPGVHEVRVARKGVALKRRVLLKPGAHVVLAADFLKNDIQAKNRESLGYEPMQGQTMLTFTSFSNTPPPRMKKTEPKAKEVTPPEKKPGNAGGASSQEPSKTPDEVESETRGKGKEKNTGEQKKLALAPPPGSGKEFYGPPVPEKYRQEAADADKEPAADTRKAGKKKGADGQDETQSREKEKPGKSPSHSTAKKSPPEKPDREEQAYPHPCPPSKSADCSEWDASTIRGSVYNYYCLLSQDDFSEAYNYWLTDRTKGWFYGAAQKFCTIHGFDIRGFEAVRESDSTARASYHVDLKERDGTVIESWKMKTSLSKKGNIWMITSTQGKPAN